jgi:hypothetical protein
MKVKLRRLFTFTVFLSVFALLISILPGQMVTAQSTVFTFKPVADAYVIKSSPDTNYGTSSSLRVDSSPTTRSYLRFTVAGLNGSSVQSATLRVYANSSNSSGYSVGEVSDNSWAENKITYNNSPPPGSTINKSASFKSGGWTQVDISSYIQGDGTYSLALTTTNSTNTNLASRESSNSPQLVINGASGATATPAKSLTPTKGPTSTSTPTMPAGTPTQTPTLPVGTPTQTPTSPIAAQGNIPNFAHIVLTVLENRDYSEVIGNSQAPYLNALAKQYVLLSDYYAVGHPSLPNYIALMSGGTQGISSDCTSCFVNVTNLADLIAASGRTWKSYQESMPSPCFLGNSGLYAQKHDPLIYFDSIRLNTALCDKSIVPISQLDTDLAANQLPNFSFIEANLCDSGHDCAISKPDTWVHALVNKLQASSAFGSNTLIIIIFDEAEDSSTASCCGMPSKAGGKVPAIFISPSAKGGFTDSTAYSHYSLLKTILTAWSLSGMGMTNNSATSAIAAPWAK